MLIQGLSYLWSQTNLRAIAIEEVDLVACPKCLLKYSKVCGWTLRAEPGGISEPDKFLPILKASLPDNLTQTLAVPWRKVCDDAWELHAQNKRGNTLIQTKEQRQNDAERLFWEFQTMSSFTQTLFSCIQFIFKILLPKKSCFYSFCAHTHRIAYGIAQHLASYFSMALPSYIDLISQIKWLRDWTSQPTETYWKTRPINTVPYKRKETRTRRYDKVKRARARSGCLDADAGCKQEGTMQN